MFIINWVDDNGFNHTTRIPAEDREYAMEHLVRWITNLTLAEEVEPYSVKVEWV